MIPQAVLTGVSLGQPRFRERTSNIGLFYINTSLPGPKLTGPASCDCEYTANMCVDFIKASIFMELLVNIHVTDEEVPQGPAFSPALGQFY